MFSNRFSSYNQKELVSGSFFLRTRLAIDFPRQPKGIMKFWNNDLQAKPPLLICVCCSSFFVRSLSQQPPPSTPAYRIFSEQQIIFGARASRLTLRDGRQPHD